MGADPVAGVQVGLVARVINNHQDLTVFADLDDKIILRIRFNFAMTVVIT